MDSVVNFGCTAANSQVIIRHHAITNEGSLPGIVHPKQCLYISLIRIRIFLLKKKVNVASSSLLETEFNSHKPPTFCVFLWFSSITAHVYLCLFLSTGYFHVQYSGDPSVTISPCSGVILPGGTTWLKVELCTDKPRLLVEKAMWAMFATAVYVNKNANCIYKRLECEFNWCILIFFVTHITLPGRVQLNLPFH